MSWQSDASRYDHLRGKFKIIVVATVFAAIVTAVWQQSIVLPLLLIVVVANATAPIWMRSKFQVDSTGAKSGFAQIQWSDVERVLIEENSIQLSPFEKETRLDAFRGVKLDTHNVSKAEVLSFIKEHVGENVRFLGE
ncbi:MAG TPA: hypothetical protein VK171_10390 [Fimbriimonas sp.]|nr:hypothetical protein [Fimbriimonas sp.]